MEQLLEAIVRKWNAYSYLSVSTRKALKRRRNYYDDPTTSELEYLERYYTPTFDEMYGKYFQLFRRYPFDVDTVRAVLYDTLVGSDAEKCSASARSLTSMAAEKSFAVIAVAAYANRRAGGDVNFDTHLLELYRELYPAYAAGSWWSEEESMDTE